MSPEITYGKVLVPTDGSATASNAVDHAIGVADRYGASLHAIYVVDTASLGSIDADMIYDSLERRGKDVLGEVERRATEAGIDGVETAMLQGRPHRRILDYADEHGIDLVVMGTHGRTGIDRYLLGSVTEKMVRVSDVPVLTVHATDGEGDAAGERAGEEDRGDGTELDG